MIGLYRLAEFAGHDPLSGPTGPAAPRTAAGEEAARALRAGLRLTDPALAGTHAVALAQALLALGRQLLPLSL
jgi:hypothetical protein